MQIGSYDSISGTILCEFSLSILHVCVQLFMASKKEMQKLAFGAD